MDAEIAGDDQAAQVPAVVAVVVTRDPGPWFEESLAALAVQDYAELSVLVLVSGGEEDPTRRIASVLPDAFVRRLTDDRGFGAAVDHALSMVEGAAFLVLCHDDCAPDPDAVHLLVEESFRSNAGIVAPKMVQWDDPSVLLHVGMNVDKTGAVVERVIPGEIDHGQHDAVRDVFLVPGGFTLIRTDLLRELGGYDPAIVAMGEDLDLCWRAQVSGARVVVAPDARVRHLETVAAGGRSVVGVGDATLQDLQRRHELRCVLVCYGFFHRLRVLPQAMVLAFGEVCVALLTRDRARYRAVTGAWWWNFRHRKQIRRRRARVASHRAFSDHEVRVLQLRGSARLSTYFSRLLHQDLDFAHGRVLDTASGPVVTGVDDPVTDDDLEPVLTGSVGLSFSENEDFDDLDDLGHRAGLDRHGRRRRRPLLSTRRSRLTAWIVAALVLLVGTRNLFGGALPIMGQFLPMPSWTGAWHDFFSTWHSAGLGTTAPGSPAFGLLGIVGTFLLGSMGQVQKVLLLACVPFGAWGTARLIRPLVSRRASFVAGITYLALPLGFDDLARGRMDALVAYAAIPWLIARLMRSSGLEPFGVGRGGVGVRTGEVGVGGAASGLGAGPAWKRTLAGQALLLGVIEAIAMVFAPGIVPMLLLVAVGLFAGSFAVGEWRDAARIPVVAGLGTVIAMVLCFPWVIGVFTAGSGAVSVFGSAVSAQAAPGWTTLVRFAVGPYGGTLFGWFLPVAALLPLVVGRSQRLAWAGRLWVVACLSWLLALLVARGWTGSFAPSVGVLLAPAAVAVAVGIGLGLHAFEVDLVDFHFGWRQLAATLGLAAAAIGVVPVVVAAGGGRWDVPSEGYALAVSGGAGSGSSFGHGLGTGLTNGSSAATSTSVTPSTYRILWLGDPSVLPTSAWPVSGGLSYSLTDGNGPGPEELWAPASPGPAANLSRAVVLAEDGETSHLGRFLADASVRFVVVVQSLAPDIAGVQQAHTIQAPPTLIPALRQQTDLADVPTAAGGYSVFENSEVIPERAVRSAGTVATTSGSGSSSGASATAAPTAANLSGWTPVLAGAPGSSSYAGTITSGTVYAALAPAGSWQLTVAGKPVKEESAFGWGAQFPSAGAGAAVLSFSGSPFIPLGLIVELLLWIAVAWLIVGQRWSLSWWRRPIAAVLSRGGGKERSALERTARTVQAGRGGQGSHAGRTGRSAGRSRAARGRQATRNRRRRAPAPVRESAPVEESP